MKRNKKISADAGDVLKSIKKVSLIIIKKLQHKVKDIKEFDEFVMNVKNGDRTINLFLKISALLCKIAAIESKTKQQDLNQNNHHKNDALNQADIQIIENFLARYNERMDNDK